MALEASALLLKTAGIKILAVLPPVFSLIGAVLVISALLGYVRLHKNMYHRTAERNGQSPDFFTYFWRVIVGVLLFSLSAFMKWTMNSIELSNSLPY